MAGGRIEAKRYPRMRDAGGRCRICRRNDRQGVEGWFERNLCVYCAAQAGKRAGRSAAVRKPDKPASAQSMITRRRK